MAENPITGKGIFTHLFTNFPSVQSAAVSHVEANGGDNFYMILVRAEPSDQAKQQQTGDNNGSKRVQRPGKKTGKTKEDEPGTGRLHTVLNRHLMKLLQEPLNWEVFGEKDKQQQTGGDSGHKHVGGKGGQNAAEEDVVQTATPQDDGFPGQGTDTTQRAADSVDAVFQTLSDLEL